MHRAVTTLLPALASIPSPGPEWRTFQIWIFTIHTYALCILAGIIVCVVLSSRRLTQRGAQPGVILDVAILAVPLGLVGARLYHVATHPGDYFGAAHPLNQISTYINAIAIWDGGNAIIGSIIGGAVGVAIACRWTGLRFWSIADAIAPGLLFAQAIGRIGNWFNNELFGLPTTLPWGLQIPSTNPAFPVGLPDGTLFHPTFLYELIWDSVGAVLILLFETKVRAAVIGGRPRFAFTPRLTMRWGRAFAMYLIWYGIGRSVFESIRVDPTEVYLGLRVNVWAAFAEIVLGIVLIAVSLRRHKGLEPSVYRPGRQWLPDGALASRYTAADFDDDPARSEVAVTSGSPSRA